MLIPGLNSSKLVVELNCQEFREHNPEHFNMCGWTSCEHNHEKAPKKEFSLWPPADFFFPDSKRPATDNELGCFLAFYKMRMVEDGEEKVKFEDRKGVKVVPLGTS